MDRSREGVVGVVGDGQRRGGAGKQPKLSPRQEAHLVQLYRAGGHTISKLEELFTVTRSTVYLAVERAGGRTGAPPAAQVQP